jgi:signal transduction histidine kinase
MHMKTNLAIVIYSLLIGVFFWATYIVASLINRQRMKPLVQKAILQSNIIHEEENEIESNFSSIKKIKREQNFLKDIIAHDLKNTLNNIHSILIIFRNNNTDLQNTQLNYLSAMQKNIQRLRVMVNNVLNIDRIESRILKLKMSRINMSSVLNDTLESSIFSAVEKQIQFIADINSDCMVLGDDNCMREIFENLISNAIKYSPVGKKVHLRLFSANEIVHFSIHNECKKIHSDEISDVFTKYTSLSNPPTGGEISTGLGLSIVKEYAQAMNGNIELESDNGFTIKFSLPSFTEIHIDTEY